MAMREPTFDEPLELEAIHKLRRSAEHRYSLQRIEPALIDRIRGGWFGYRAGWARSAAVDAAVESGGRAILAGLETLERYGRGFSPSEAGAEAQAGASGSEAGVSASVLWGFVNPGRPSRAAEMAWRQRRTMGEPDDIYAAMVIAATTAVAFVADDLVEAAYVGISEIPDSSRLYRAAREVMRLHPAAATADEGLESLAEDAAQTVSGAAAGAVHLIISLFHSGGDPALTLDLAARGGRFGRLVLPTAGAILGAHLGFGSMQGLVGGADESTLWGEPLDRLAERTLHFAG